MITVVFLPLKRQAGVGRRWRDWGARFGLFSRHWRAGLFSVVASATLCRRFATLLMESVT
jgi:hypothetical protein